MNEAARTNSIQSAPAAEIMKTQRLYDEPPAHSSNANQPPICEETCIFIYIFSHNIKVLCR